MVRTIGNTTRIGSLIVTRKVLNSTCSLSMSPLLDVSLSFHENLLTERAYLSSSRSLSPMLTCSVGTRTSRVGALSGDTRGDSRYIGFWLSQGGSDGCTIHVVLHFLA